MRYPGGKAASGTYQQIINLIPPHRVYIETHLGGGAIVRAKRPAAVNILIDLDAAAIAGFDGAFDGGGISPSSTAGNSDASGLASAVPEPITVPGDARDHRHFQRGGPTSPSPAILASPATNSEAGSRFHLLNTDALDFLRAYPFQGDEFIYCDPPYLMTTRSSPRRIYRCEMSEADHVALLACLKALPCKVMLSGYYSDLYTDTLAGWYTHTFEAITRAGKTATEWLWMNYPRPVALHQYDYLGSGFRERERIKRKKTRWVERLRRMPALEKQAILAAIAEVGD